MLLYFFLQCFYDSQPKHGNVIISAGGRKQPCYFWSLLSVECNCDACCNDAPLDSFGHPWCTRSSIGCPCSWIPCGGSRCSYIGQGRVTCTASGTLVWIANLRLLKISPRFCSYILGGVHTVCGGMSKQSYALCIHEITMFVNSMTWSGLQTQ